MLPLLLLASTLLQPKAPPERERPNFVFMYADDQRWDALGVVQREQARRARFPWLRTPNLDRLAAEGVRFRNAFVTHSLCTPSRASFLTGRYTHAHGVLGNFTSFPSDAVTYASLLRKAGYRTAYVGKWHMGDEGGRRPGFDHTASYRGHGRYFDCPFEVNGEKTSTKGWVDDVATDHAIDFIRRQGKNPFALVLGFKTPHEPFSPPPRLAGRWKGKALGPPANWGAHPVYLGRVHVARREYIKPEGNRPVADPLDYFRGLAGVDENVGRVLEALDAAGIAGRTVVVYSSDNGYHLGEHGIGDKRSAYEESIRIPLLVRYPGWGGRTRPGSVIDALVLNIDLAPTFLDLAGLPVPPDMQGKSWRPLLEGRAKALRDDFLYEYFFYRDIADYELQTANPPITPTITAVRTTSAKLITYPGRDWVELFDLSVDPYEIVNLAKDPRRAWLLQEMQARLERQLRETRFRIPSGANDVPLKDLEEWRR